MTNQEAKKNIVAYMYYAIDDLPEDVGKALDIAIKALEQEPCEVEAAKQAYSKGFEDCRQAVLDEAFEVDTKEYGRIEVVGVDAINALQSVTPQQKTGYWIDDKCSVLCATGK